MDELSSKLLSELKKNKIIFSEKNVLDAYELASKAHAGQLRHTGEAYITHPIEVAKLLSQLSVDEQTIIAAILHDTLEDTDVTEAEITNKFGTEVLNLVEGVTKLRRTHLKSEDEKDIENVKKLILASTKDIRILLIKLADRLHNARTIEGLGAERRISYAKELLTVFAPLAEYLGVGLFQREFEDIGFYWTHPEDYHEIKKALDSKKQERLELYSKFVKELKNILIKNKIKHQIFHREKSVYSIYKKIKKYKKEKLSEVIDIHDLYDIFAVRIIVNNLSNCYQTLGLVHSRWPYIPEEFDDFISKPKPNGYKSIHTILNTNRWGYIEVQIRTKEMHEYNEFGPASHLAYKKSGQRNAKATDKFKFVKNLVKWQSLNLKKKEDHYSLDLFRENIFVFTKDGALVELPKGSTPIDFAYHVHTSVGDNCVGVKVNGEMRDLSYELKMGDKVEILVSRSRQYPKKDWLNVAKTTSAKTKIRKGLREKDEFESIEKGKSMLFGIAKSIYKININELESRIKDNINLFSVANIDELYSRIGFGLLRAEPVIKIAFPETNIAQIKTKKLVRQINKRVHISGYDDLEYELAGCCDPKSNDDIVAYITADHKTKIHKINCTLLKKHKDINKIIPANWGD